MAAAKGNQLWKKRYRHGRLAVFTEPSTLWEAACEYFEWCDANPLEIEEAIKSGELAGTCMTVQKARAYSLTAFMVFIEHELNWWRNFKKSQTAQQDGFSAVMAQIESVMYSQKFEGASAGVFNANLIARDLGLREHTDVTSDDKPLAAAPAINIYTPGVVAPEIKDEEIEDTEDITAAE